MSTNETTEVTEVTKANEAVEELEDGAELPLGRIVPEDLIDATIDILLQLPGTHGYLILRRWAEIRPERLGT